MGSKFYKFRIPADSGANRGMHMKKWPTASVLQKKRYRLVKKIWHIFSSSKVSLLNLALSTLPYFDNKYVKID